MINIPSIIRQDKEVTASIATVREQLSAKSPLPVIINGLSGGSADAYLIEAIRELSAGEGATPSLVLASSDAERTRLTELLSVYGLRALELKPRELVLHNVSASHDVDRERLSVLSALLSRECDAVITTPSAALAYTMPAQMLSESVFTLCVGDEIAPKELLSRLLYLGYARVDMVESAGQISLRSDILDIWLSVSLPPIRVEFFGDEIDRIAYFDAETQRSIGDCAVLTVAPAREVLMGEGEQKRTVAEIEKLIAASPSAESLQKLQLELATLLAGLELDSRDRYLGVIYKQPQNPLDYFSSVGRCAVFVLGTNECREQASVRYRMLEEQRAELLSLGIVTDKAAKYSAPPSALEDFLAGQVAVHINSFAGGVGNMRASGLFGCRARVTSAYGGNSAILYDDLRSYRKSAYRTVILAESEQGADSLINALSGEDIFATPIYKKDDFDLASAEGGSILVDVGGFSGFELITPKIAVLSMARPEGKLVMEKRRQKRILKRAGGAGQRLMSYADLSVGDYVVHANYGIGLFEGIESVTVDGVTRDYITIKYAGTDKLFVPCDKLELIGKYIGARDDTGKVKLSKMGGGEWQRQKSKTKSAVKDIARELISLYAERQKKPGFAFGADTDLEDEFAASFEYEETESQLVAIEEIKADMMRPVPMNRLLCGDVGFGKTEVALRAAFKAIMGGKQVAILVPTTLLAMQHYQTALSRMRNYPVTIEMISRFRTPTQLDKILKKVARGEVDMLIGTHKLLSKQVSFRDLGLLIIDEEQRFGVSQKEKLKQMARNVDVLTLSATPIPRTLNMAMNGISDMSILDEAPGDRHPVQTYVLEHDEAVINDAIRRELNRDGQVLYVYNRIDDIDLVATRLMRAMPEARIAVAHGGMDKDEIEDIWSSLVEGEIDVLVCTTIIETGVDLPNANTLVIENADRMGLSQLHQLRGRVGRSERQAYAYFTFRQGKALSDVARKRLVAIREFATFGAGFKVALRDLEIRGAGNLLGAEQHGYIESVGYDLYVKLLSEAVLEESGRTPEPEPTAHVDIRISASIPESYIHVSSQRMEMYKKISLIRDSEDMQDVLDELIDRFGAPPKQTEALLKISLIRALAESTRISRVEYTGGSLVFYQQKPELGAWSEVFSAIPGLSFRAAAASPGVVYKVKKGERELDVAIKILSGYKAAADTKEEKQ